MIRSSSRNATMKTLTGIVIGTFMVFVSGLLTAAPSGSLSTDLVSLSQTMPKKVSINEPIPVVVTVTARQSVDNVVITTTAPANTRIVKTEPQGAVAGNKVTWKVGELAQGANAKLTLVITAAAEGSVECCSTVSAEPKICVATIVGKPVINITKTGPAEALLNSNVDYTVTVWNSGTSVAKDVVITDTIPAGLTHASGQKSLTFQVGDLAPEQKVVKTVTLKAAQRGEFCNLASVATSNAGTEKAQACTKVLIQELVVTKTGMAKQYTRKTADYTITARNPGDVTLTNVVITDTAPAGTTIVKASGAQVTGNTATWKVAELKPNQTVSKSLTLTSEVAGTHCNGVTVTTAQNVNGQAEACTEWIGFPAILIEVVDTKDPLLPGEETTYEVRVTNQGTAVDTNVRIVANFPAEISPTSASGDTAITVAGKTVNAAAYPVLRPKQVITWKIKAKAETSTGDSRLKVLLYSDLLKTPVTEEESTHVY